MFEDFIEFLYLPEGYNYDVSWTMRNGNTDIEKYIDKNKSFNELSKDIFNNAVSVLEWAEGLEEYKEQEESNVNL